MSIKLMNDGRLTVMGSEDFTMPPPYCVTLRNVCSVGVAGGGEDMSTHPFLSSISTSSSSGSEDNRPGELGVWRLLLLEVWLDEWLMEEWLVLMEVWLLDVFVLEAVWLDVVLLVEVWIAAMLLLEDEVGGDGWLLTMLGFWIRPGND